MAIQVLRIYHGCCTFMAASRALVTCSHSPVDMATLSHSLLSRQRCTHHETFSYNRHQPIICRTLPEHTGLQEAQLWQPCRSKYTATKVADFSVKQNTRGAFATKTSSYVFLHQARQPTNLVETTKPFKGLLTRMSIDEL